MEIKVLGIALGKTLCNPSGTMLSMALAAGIVIIEPTEGSDV